MGTRWPPLIYLRASCLCDDGSYLPSFATLSPQTLHSFHRWRNWGKAGSLLRHTGIELASCIPPGLTLVGLGFRLSFARGPGPAAEHRSIESQLVINNLPWTRLMHRYSYRQTSVIELTVVTGLAISYSRHSRHVLARWQNEAKHGQPPGKESRK